VAAKSTRNFGVIPAKETAPPRAARAAANSQTYQRRSAAMKERAAWPTTEFNGRDIFLLGEHNKRSAAHKNTQNGHLHLPEKSQILARMRENNLPSDEPEIIISEANQPQKIDGTI